MNILKSVNLLFSDDVKLAGSINTINIALELDFKQVTNRECVTCLKLHKHSLCVLTHTIGEHIV